MTPRKMTWLLLRGAARVIGALLVGAAVLFAVGEGIQFQSIGLATGSMLVAFLTALCGMLVLWRWQLVGGLLVLLGMTAFYTIEYATSGKLPSGWVLPACYVPGVLALMSCVVKEDKKEQ